MPADRSIQRIRSEMSGNILELKKGQETRLRVLILAIILTKMEGATILVGGNKMSSKCILRLVGKEGDHQIQSDNNWHSYL